MPLYNPAGGAPSGSAGGVLGGTYPDPSFAADMATQAELNTVIARELLREPAGTLAVSVPRQVVANTNSTVQGSRVHAVLVVARGGVPITNVVWLSGATALSVGVNQWAGLYTTAGVMIRQSTDKTSETWAANAEKSFAMLSTYTPASDELVYATLSVTATTTPTLATASSGSVINGLAPKAYVRTSAVITDPASGAGPLTFDFDLSGIAYARLT